MRSTIQRFGSPVKRCASVRLATVIIVSDGDGVLERRHKNWEKWACGKITSRSDQGRISEKAAGSSGKWNEY